MLFRRFIAGLRAVFDRTRSEKELDDEISAFLETAVEEKVRGGMSRTEATRAARLELGSAEAVKDRVRDIGWESFLESVGQDLRYAVRSLGRSPGFAAVAILTLAVGIGASTTIYSVVDTVLVQPLPFRNSDRLVRLVENVSMVVDGRPPSQQNPTFQSFLEWRAGATTVPEVAAFSALQRLVRAEGTTLRLWGGRTSTNAFEMFGARALLGRTLAPTDEGNPDVVVLTHESWRRVFRADPAIVGASIDLRAQRAWRRATIVGVLPAEFEFPVEPGVDFYTPFAIDEASGRFSTTVIGRLAPGVEISAATDEANVIGGAVPARNNRPLPPNMPRFEVQSLKDRTVQGLRPALRLFVWAVAALLLIVCANVANLLLARGTARQREIAVRFALGAGRARVARQILTECLVLAGVGGALGALIGGAGVALVKQVASVEAPGIFRILFATSILPRVREIGIDARMFATASGLTLLTSLLVGAFPVLQLSRSRSLQMTAARSGSPGTSRLRAALVVGQLTMATILLIGAGLLAHSFFRLSTVEKGYDSSNVLSFQLVFPDDASVARKAETIERVLARLRANPNVESAGFSRHGILIGEEIFVGTLVPQGQALEEVRTDAARPGIRAVSHGYLTAVGARLLQGRGLKETDSAGAPPVAVVTRTVAERYFKTGSPLGQSVDWHNDSGRPVQIQVVGVVEDVRNESPDREARPEVFVDYRQLLAIQQQWDVPVPRQDSSALGFLSFAVRTRHEPSQLAPAVGDMVRAVDSTAGVDAVIPLDRLMPTSVGRRRFYAVMLGVFAAVAGLLAAIGVYGVLAYAVVQRTQEIGIRMALGARRGQVLALVLRKGLTLTTAGIALGLVGAVASTRLLQGMLFGITPLDAMTFATVSLAFGVVAMFASYIPARRATKVDPTVALRAE